MIILYSEYGVSEGFISNISWGVYSIPKESKYTVVVFSIKNEIEFGSLLCLLSGFMTYVLAVCNCTLYPLFFSFF